MRLDSGRDTPEFEKRSAVLDLGGDLRPEEGVGCEHLRALSPNPGTSLRDDPEAGFVGNVERDEDVVEAQVQVVRDASSQQLRLVGVADDRSEGGMRNWLSK